MRRRRLASRRRTGDARLDRPLSPAGHRRVNPRERFVRGWEEGFAPGPARLLSVAGGGYRGLLGAREGLDGRGVLEARGLPCPPRSLGNLPRRGKGKTPAFRAARPY